MQYGKCNNLQMVALTESNRVNKILEVFAPQAYNIVRNTSICFGPLKMQNQQILSYIFYLQVRQVRRT
jgi:hypothetical protein